MYEGKRLGRNKGREWQNKEIKDVYDIVVVFFVSGCLCSFQVNHLSSLGSGL